MQAIKLMIGEDEMKNVFKNSTSVVNNSPTVKEPRGTVHSIGT